jgi:hypothetical protein
MTQDTKWFDGELVIQANFEDMVQDILLMEKGQGPFSRIVELALNEAVMVLAKLIVDNTPSNTGALSGAISQAKSVYYESGVFYGEVGDGGIPYAAPVEYGRKPGKQPPVEDIKLWVLRKQLQWYRDGKPMSVDQMAWSLARHIGKEGTEAVEMYKKGLEQSKPQVDIIWERMLDDIIREWGRWEHSPPEVR